MRSPSCLFGLVVAVFPTVAVAQTVDNREFESPDAVDAPPWWSRVYLRPLALHTIEGFRLPARGLEPISELVGEHKVLDGAYGVDRGDSTRGIENLSVGRGSNEMVAMAAAAGGWQSAELTARASGPISRDDAWFFAGVAPRVDGNWSAFPWAASVALALSPETQGHAWTVGAATAGTTSRVYDDVLDQPRAFKQTSAAAGHGWRIRFGDARNDLHFAIGAYRDRLDVKLGAMPATVTDGRVAVRSSLVRRQRALGYHVLSAGVEAASGRADDAIRMRSLETTEVSGYASDSWQILPNFSLDTGVRWSQQLADDGRSDELHEQIQPRAGAVYDWTKEGRSKIYAHWGRYWRPATLDEPTPDVVDESLGGVEYELLENVTTGVAGVLRSDYDSVRVTAQARMQWLRANMIYDSHLGLDLRASVHLKFLSPHLVGTARIYTAQRVPSSLRLEYFMRIWDQNVRCFSDILVDEDAPDIRLGVRGHF